MKRGLKEGVHFHTYRPSGGFGEGWNWYCMVCPSLSENGWRQHRADARKDARAHIESVHPEQPKTAGRDDR
jgi:hypothetical protein